jgi:hypothetical protein
MDAPPKSEPWQVKAELQKLIDNACLHDRDTRGKPVVWKDRAGHGVSLAALKGTLNALLSHYPNMFPSIATLASRSGQKPRTIERAIEVLELQEILVVDRTRNSRGQKQNRYTILTTKLAYLGEDGRMPLFKKPMRPESQAKRPGGKSQAPPQQSLAPWVQTQAPPGAHEHCLNIDEDKDEQAGAGKFSGEEREQIIYYANRAATFVGRPRGDQVEFLILVGVWILRGPLAEGAFEECLEAVERRRPDNRFGYFRSCLKNKLAEGGQDLDVLLASTMAPSRHAATAGRSP